MILGRPWALALLLVPPILLWLRLRAARPRAAEASSLLVWSRVSPSDAPAARPRPPLAAWLEAAGAVLLAVGLADPAVSRAGASAVRVLLDVSPSMQAKGPDGRTRIEAARAAIGSFAQVEDAPDLERALPGLLAAGTPVVVVTDRRLPSFPDDPPRFQSVGVGTPAFNAGITAASGVPIEDEMHDRSRVFLTIEVRGSAVPVQGRLRLPYKDVSLTLSPGPPLEVTQEFELPDGAPELGAHAVRLEFPGDSCSADDAVGFEWRGGVHVEFSGRRLKGAEPLVRALVAAGAVPNDIDSPSLDLDGGPRVLVFLPSSGTGRQVQGTSVVCGDHPLVKDVRVDPSVTLGERSEAVIGGTPVLLDDKGPLITVEEKSTGVWASAHTVFVHLAFVPGGTWVERDPSFVVLARNLVECAGGGPTNLIGLGVLSGEETRQAAEGETFGDLRAALDAARRPDPASRHPLASILLLGGAALLFAAWFASR